MLKNYFKTTFRNLWKHRVFSMINLTGLAVGMTACFLIFLYVRFELSYDAYHSQASRIYRVVCDIKTPTETIHANNLAWAMPSNIKAEFPEIKNITRVLKDKILIRQGDIKFQEERAAWADSTLFSVFDFTMIKGNARTALKEPLTVVLTENGARKYFGNQDPMGKTLLVTGDAYPAVVTGLIKNVPENSLIGADLYFSMSSITQKFDPKVEEQWGNFGTPTYIVLGPGINPKTLESKFPAFLQKRDGDQMAKSKMSYGLFLEPLKDVYLRSTRDGSSTGNINNVYIFSVVAVFILLIACINFINLSTARSTERAKEVGIRKVAGAGRTQLARQFIAESMMLCFISFILALLLTAFFLPLFNTLAGKIISTGICQHPVYILVLFLGSVIIGSLAGIYPALILSSFMPIMVLKGKFTSGTKGILLRKGLVVAQFAISIALIISTIVVYTQMKYMRTQDLGFNKDQMLVFDTEGDPARDAFRQAVSGLPEVKATAMSSSVPGSNNPGAYSQIENKQGDLQIANLDLYFVDWDYINQFQIKMVAGRSFSRDFGTDTTQAMLLNESAVKMFGYSSPEQAVGRRFQQWGRTGKIIGVMKDFHFRSLQEIIKPLSMRIEPRGCTMVSVKIAGGNIPATIKAIEEKWKTAMPNRPFSYFFMDQFFDKQYASEEKFGKLFLNFAILAIFISCLGLLGLASYSTMQRTKEIGIRKVLGASVSGIVNLLSLDFLKLVLIAFFIASPIAWFFMYRWLQDFAYRTRLSGWVFVLAGLMAVLIALLTISVQAVKAAVSNPVKSLRTE